MRDYILNRVIEGFGIVKGLLYYNTLRKIKIKIIMNFLSHWKNFSKYVQSSYKFYGLSSGVFGNLFSPTISMKFIDMGIQFQ